MQLGYLPNPIGDDKLQIVVDSYRGLQILQLSHLNLLREGKSKLVPNVEILKHTILLISRYWLS